MYDKNRMKKFTTGLTVKELIEALKEYPQDAKVDICGDSYCYIHVEKNDSVVNIDNEELDECYEVVPENTCGHCGSSDLDFGAAIIEETWVVYPFTCKDCGEKGRLVII